MVDMVDANFHRDGYSSAVRGRLADRLKPSTSLPDEPSTPLFHVDTDADFSDEVAQRLMAIFNFVDEISLQLSEDLVDFAQKMVTYGADSLTQFGNTVFPKHASPSGALQAGASVYLAGKIFRAMDSLKRGITPTRDTYRDIVLYGIMCYFPQSTLELASSLGNNPDVVSDSVASPRSCSKVEPDSRYADSDYEDAYPSSNESGSFCTAGCE